MLNSLFKTIPVIALGLGVGLNAQPYSQEKKVEPYNNVAPCCEPVCGINESQCTCWARGCTCELGIAVEVDFLYWRAENRGFSLAYEETSPSTRLVDGLFPVGNIGKVVRLKSKWDPGFRVGIGWNTDFDRWDVFADWTWFRDRSHLHRSLNVAPDVEFQGFYPQWPLDDLHFNDLSGSWELLHNAVDLELGRAYYITKALSLRPHWGLRGASINQRFKSDLSVPLFDITELEEIIFHGNNNFWGVGPRVGLHSQWHIASSNWNVLGKASGSLLLGKTRMKARLDEVIESVEYLARSTKDNFSQLVPNLQLFLGIGWGSCLNCNKYFLGIDAGWEANFYWNQYNIPQTISDGIPTCQGTGNQAVTMEGLTVNVHFDF